MSFLDSESIVFGDFKDCIYKEELAPFNELYVGIDWGSGVGNDDTVVTALNERDEQVFMLAFNNKNTLQQVGYIAEYIKDYGKQSEAYIGRKQRIRKTFVRQLETAYWQDSI